MIPTPNCIMPTPFTLTHISQEDAFIKVWGIVDQEKWRYIRDIIDVYTEKLQQGEGMVRALAELIPGKLVLTLHDGAYHRAEILQLDNVSMRRVLVFFIDLGITTAVEVGKIRLADMCGAFNTIPRTGLAIDYVLQGAVVKRQWQTKDLDSLNMLIPHCSDFSPVCVVGEDIKIINLSINVDKNKMSLSSFLVSNQLADFVRIDQLQSMLRNKYEQQVPLGQFQVPPPSMTAIQIPPTFNIPHQSAIVGGSAMFENHGPPPGIQPYHSVRSARPITTPTASVVQIQTPTPTTYGIDTLQPGSTHEVYVSHVIEGLHSFTIQLKSVVDLKLPRLMARINDTRLIPFTDPLGPGMLCLGRYSLDKSLCRAVVSSVIAEGAQLYFVDFGNTESVPVNEIYRIPPEFVQDNVMALRFTLADLHSNYILTTDEASKIFQNLVLKEDRITMKVTLPEMPTKQYCELYVTINGKPINIKKMILDKVKLMKPVEYKRIPFKKNHVVDIVVPFSESPLKFFAQLEVNQSMLDLIMRCVEEYCTTSEHKDILYVEDVNENMAVCAPYEDEKWYRGLIVDEPDAEGYVTIFYVDFGNQDSVHFSKLRIMNNEMMQQFPMQAIECRLDIDSSIVLDEEVNQFFIDMVDGNSFRMNVLNILPAHVLLVDLTGVDNINITQHLREFCACRSPQRSISSPSYSVPPKPMQKSPSGNWREKEIVSSNNVEGDFSSFRRDENQLDRGKSSKQRDEGIDVTDDALNKKIEFWGRDRNAKTSRQSSDSGDPSWRKDRFSDEPDDKYNRKPTQRNRDESWGNSRDDRRPHRRRDDDFNSDRGGRRNSDNDFGNKNAGGERRSEKSWGKEEDSFSRPRRDDGNWKDRQEGGFNDRRRENDGFNERKRNGFENRGRRDFRSNDGGFNQNTDKPNWDSSSSFDNKRQDTSWGNDNKRQDSSWGNDNKRQNSSWGGDKRQNSYRGNDNKRDGGFKSKDGGFRKREDDGFVSRNTVTLLDGFEKGAQITNSNYQPGQKLDVIITWFVNPSRFYVMPAENEDFRRLMDEMQSEYPKRQNLNCNELAPNDFVVAKDKDDVIYRASVLRTTPRGVIVTFVDYGNSETVNENKVWNISPDHGVIPQQAIYCGLHNIVSSDENGVWPSSNNYDTYFEKDRFTITLVECLEEDTNKIWMVNLSDNDVDVGDQLVADGLARKKTVLISEDPYEIDILKNQILPSFLGAVMSSKKFFVHIEPHKANHIDECIEALTSKPEHLLPLAEENIVAGEFCLAMSSKNKYYRALILSSDQTSKKAEIAFIDYGDRCELDFDAMRVLPQSLMVYNAQAMECCLYEGESFDNDEAFVGALEDKDFIIKVMDVKDNKLHVKVFNVDGTCHPFPVESDEVVPVICPTPIVKVSENVYISAATNENVYLQRISDQEFLIDLNNRLFEKYDSESELEKVPVEQGKFYAAKSSIFEGWYRCRLVENSQNMYYIDYGNTEPIETLLAVRPLAEEFLETPACCIIAKTPALLTGDMAPLLTVVQEIIMVAKFKTYENKWTIDLVDVNGKSFADYAIECGCGEKLAEEEVEFYDAFANWKLYEEKNVVVSAVHNPALFYVQLKEDVERLTKMQEELQNALQNALPLVGSCDDIVAGQFEGKWYRCRQKDNFAIDYGFFVDDNLYKRLSNKFTQDKNNYIVECGLNVVPNSTQWEPNVIEHFKKLVTSDGNEKLIARLEFSGEKKIVELIANNSSLTEFLVNDGEAVYKAHFVTVSHVVSMSEFYIQQVEMENELFNLLDRLKEAEEWEIINPEVNELVAAKFLEDEQWYRAEVVDLTDGVCVRFVDYGNTSVCRDFRVLPDELKDIPKFASVCSIHPLPEDVAELNPIFVEFVKNHCEEYFSIYYLNRIEPMLVMLYYKDDLVDTLIRPHSIDFSSASISHINSPSSFYVQTETSVMETISGELENVENTDPVTDLKLNELYAAKYDYDGLWYRAKVIDISETYGVLFVDYGNASEITELRYLPETIKDIPPLAKHCSIPTPPGLLEWPEVATQKFAELSCDGNTIFKMEIIEDGDPADVMLTDNGISVMDELTTLCKAELTATSKNYKPNAVISFITSIDQIWIQEQTPALDELAEDLANVDTCDPLETAENDAIVAALFDEDGFWYRAKVLGKLENGFRVLFIDYGNESEITLIKSLPEDLAKMPPFAICCKLLNLTNDSEKALNKLKEIYKSGELFVLEEKIEENGVYYVSLKYENDKYLSDELNQLNCEDQINAVISDVQSLTEFSLQENTQAVTGMQDFIQNSNELEDAEPVIGNVVAALNEEDNTWYRGRIESVEDDGSCRVLNIDFGWKFPAKKLKTLSPEITETSPLAVKCCLKLSEEEKLRADEVLDQFKELVNSQNLTFKVTKTKSVNDPTEVTEVQLFHNSTDIIDLLFHGEEAYDLLLPAENVSDLNDKIEGEVIDLTEIDAEVTNEARELIDKVDDNIEIENLRECHKFETETECNEVLVVATEVPRSVENSVDEDSIETSTLNYVLVYNKVESKKDESFPVIESKIEKMLSIESDEQVIDEIELVQDDIAQNNIKIECEKNEKFPTHEFESVDNVIAHNNIEIRSEKNEISLTAKFESVQDDVNQNNVKIVCKKDECSLMREFRMAITIDDQMNEQSESLLDIVAQNNVRTECKKNESSSMNRIIDDEVTEKYESVEDGVTQNDVKTECETNEISSTAVMVENEVTAKIEFVQNNITRSNTEITCKNESSLEKEFQATTIVADNVMEKSESMRDDVEQSDLEIECKKDVMERSQVSETVLDLKTETSVIVRNDVEIEGDKVEGILSTESDVEIVEKFNTKCDIEEKSEKSRDGFIFTRESEINDQTNDVAQNKTNGSPSILRPEIENDLIIENLRIDDDEDECKENESFPVTKSQPVSITDVETNDYSIKKFIDAIGKTVCKKVESLTTLEQKNSNEVIDDVFVGSSNISESPCENPNEIVRSNLDEKFDSLKVTCSNDGVTECCLNSEPPRSSLESLVENQDEFKSCKSESESTMKSTETDLCHDSNLSPFEDDLSDNVFDSRDDSLNASKAGSVYLSVNNSEIDQLLSDVCERISDVASKTDNPDVCGILNDSKIDCEVDEQTLNPFMDLDSEEKSVDVSCAITKELTSANKKMTIDNDPSISEGVKNFVFVVYVNNPGSFYVQKISDQDEIGKMSSALRDIEKIELQDPSINSLVLVKIEDEYVRAKILDKDDYNGYDLLCIDRGNLINAAVVFELPETLKSIPALAQHCGLPLPEHLNSWPEAICDEFVKTTQVGNPVYKLIEVEKGCDIVYVNLIDEYVDIGKKMNELCSDIGNEVDVEGELMNVICRREINFDVVGGGDNFFVNIKQDAPGVPIEKFEK